MPALPVYSPPLINIGLGDFAFFSVLISAAVIISFELVTPFPLLLAIIGLFGGAYYTFQFLKEDRALPGLPLPIFGGIGFLIFGVITSMILGGVTLESIIGLFG
jgi:presenilin-like A22 family membrane protease